MGILLISLVSRIRKDVLVFGIANHSGKVLECLRWNTTQVQQLLVKREPAIAVFETCGTAHHWMDFPLFDRHLN